MKLHRFLPFAALLAAAFATRAADAPKSSAPAPAKVANAIKETDLASITLTPEAVQRLGIKTVALERRAMPQTRLLPGEVVVSLGKKDNPNAPVIGGTLEEVLKFADLQADANGRIRQARVQLDAAKVTLDRAQKMLKAEAGSARTVDDAQAQLKLAESAHATATERRALLGEPVDKAMAGSKLWIRVPVYVGLVEQLDRSGPATIRTTGSIAKSQSALPITGPKTANATSTTLDLYYELDGAPEGMRPGSRIEVLLPVRGSTENLVVSHDAVLHDIQGGQWIYEQTAPNVFTRRRVEVQRIEGALAVLSRGPKAGAAIVTSGSVELFGTEFGSGK